MPEPQGRKGLSQEINFFLHFKTDWAYKEVIAKKNELKMPWNLHHRL